MANKEESRAKARKYYYEHLDECKERSRKWKKLNRKRASELQREWSQANPNKRREYERKYRINHPDKYAEASRRRYLRYAYKLSMDEYNEIFDKQEGRCAICHKHQSELNTPLCIDHDHETDDVRGLLCSNCNSMLGMADDNQSLLQEAIEYLKQRCMDGA